VDAQEGPMPQTRFVLKKSLELGLKPILVLNKIDKPGADAERAHDEVLNFMELGATDEQLILQLYMQSDEMEQQNELWMTNW
jgi:GTP-binding protein